jgi:hypothetical protein
LLASRLLLDTDLLLQRGRQEDNEEHKHRPPDAYSQNRQYNGNDAHNIARDCHAALIGVAYARVDVAYGVFAEDSRQNTQNQR